MPVMVVAGLQLLCGFVLLCVMSLTSNWNSDYIFALFLQLENAQEIQEKVYV